MDTTTACAGTPIGRAPLVKLFSSILRKDGEAYFLVTPVEKVGIRVIDAPFVAVDFRAEGTGRDQILTFVTHVDDEATAGPDHPIRVARDPATGDGEVDEGCACSSGQASSCFKGSYFDIVGR